uniref:Putative secreted protein n=1 Tax=Corethrella appendiculata TaxID=1370023 RepID=U5ETG3_9DIPT
MKFKLILIELILLITSILILIEESDAQAIPASIAKSFNPGNLVKSFTKGIGKQLLTEFYGTFIFLMVAKVIQQVLGQVFPAGPSEVQQLQMDVMNRFDDVTNQVKQMSSIIITEVSKSIEKNTYLTPVLMKIDGFKQLLERRESEFRSYLKNSQSTNENADDITKNFQTGKFKNRIKKLADSIVSYNPTSIASQTRLLFQELSSSSSVTSLVFVDRYIKSLKRSKYQPNCDTVSSPQQTFLNFFKFLLDLDVRATTLTIFAYEIETIYMKRNYSAEIQILELQYEQRLVNYLKVIEDNIHRLSTEYWKCDPKQHVESETYLELKRLATAHFDFEAAIASGCTKSCTDIKDASIGFSSIHGSRKCHGKMGNCKNVGDTIEYCLTLSETASTYLEYFKSKQITFENKRNCVDIKTVHQAKCEYCFCECQGDPKNPNSIHFLSLRAEESNIEENKVVVGLRFIQVGQVIALQIREAPLLEGGFADKKLAQWKPISPFDLTSTTQVFKFDFKNRKLQIKDLQFDNKHFILTGIKFAVNRMNIPDIHIKYTFGNVKTGTLSTLPKDSGWKHDSNYWNSEFGENLAHPTQCNEDQYHYLQSGENVKFSSSNWGSNAGQATVPFFDAQEVSPEPPMALAGAGIIHRGAKSCSGFIAPIVHTIRLETIDDPKSGEDIDDLENIWFEG